MRVSRAFTVQDFPVPQGWWENRTAIPTAPSRFFSDPQEPASPAVAQELRRDMKMRKAENTLSPEPGHQTPPKMWGEVAKAVRLSQEQWLGRRGPNIRERYSLALPWSAERMVYGISMEITYSTPLRASRQQHQVCTGLSPEQQGHRWGANYRPPVSLGEAETSQAPAQHVGFRVSE